MQRREQILLIGFVGILGVSVIGPRVWEMIQGPVRELQAEQTNLASTVKTAEGKFDEALKARRKLKLWKARSLSPNPQQAAVFYQQWLTDTAELVAGLREVSVAPERMLTAAGRTYVGVRMKLTARGTFPQVRTFLYNYYRIDLLHRLVQLQLTKNEDNPELLSVNLTTEGVSLSDAPKRGAQLFPRTILQTQLSSSATSITVANSEDFPDQAPFRIRMDGEYCRVTNITEKSWTLARGVDETTPVPHEVEAEIEFAPVHPEFPEKLADLNQLLQTNPFDRAVTPKAYEPRLLTEGNTRVGKEGKLDLLFKLSGFDSGKGGVKYAVTGNLPENFLLEELENGSARLSWMPPVDQQPARFDAKISIEQTEGGVSVWSHQQELAFTYNNLPEFQPITPPPAAPGEKLEIPFEATDPDLPNDELTYSTEKLPEGGTLDAKTGLFTWRIPADSSEVSLDLTVTVADKLGATARQSLTISTGEDAARQTFLAFTGSGFSGKPQAWLRNRDSKKTLMINQGEEFEVADIKATLTEITTETIMFKWRDELWKVKLGQNLRTMVKQPTPPKLKRASVRAPKPE